MSDLFREPHSTQCLPGCLWCPSCWCHTRGLWDDDTDANDDGEDCD